MENSEPVGYESSRRDVVIKGGIAAVGLGAVMYTSGKLGSTVGKLLDTGADIILGDPHDGTHETGMTALEVNKALENQEHQLINTFIRATDEQAVDHSETAHGPETLDWIGTGVFAHGIRELSKGRSITQGHYFSQGALVALKRHKARQQDDHEMIHHIDEELAATLNFTGIIEGTVIVAEGMTLDVEAIYKDVTARSDLLLEDRVAIVTQLSSLLAPLVTTVGASGMTTKEASKIVDQAQKLALRMVDETVHAVSSTVLYQKTEAEVEESMGRIKALLQSHISDKAGFPFFGDPPFIATIERFGLQGLAWQSLSVGTVPALRSLAYTNKLITKELISLGAMPGEVKDASRLSTQALKRNFGFVGGVMTRSIKNLGLPLVGKDQDKNGMQHHVLSAFSDKVDGFRDLLVKDHIESHGHEVEGSRIEDAGRYGQFISSVLANLPERPNHHGYDRLEMQRTIKNYVSEGEWQQLHEWLEQHDLGSPMAEAFVRGAQEVEAEIEQSLGFGNDETFKWSPLAIYRRVTDITRMQNALGHSFTDVLDVFPFQSMSMIFVSPVFKELVSKFDSVTEKIPVKVVRDIVNDFGKYAGITAFSSVADNLVGVREGYKFTEHNPSIALIAGIQGGMLLPPGNMANVVSFPLNVYGIEEAKKQIVPIHAKPLAEGFVWAQLLGLADKTGINAIGFPAPKIASTEATHALEVQNNDKTMSRRSLLRSIVRY